MEIILNMLPKIIQQIKTSKFWKSVTYLTLGSSFAQILGILTTPILSRIYSVSEFGEFALLLSLSAILSTLVSFGLPSAIMGPNERNKNIEVFVFVSIISLFFSILLFFFAIFFSQSISIILNSEDIFNFLVILFFLTTTNLIKSFLSILMNKFSENRVLVINILITSFSTLLFSIPLGFLGFTKYGLGISATLSSLISIVQMFYRVKNDFKGVSYLNLKHFIKLYSRFILFQFPSNIIEILSLQIPTQFLSQFYGTNILGSYYMNEKLLGIPSRLIGTPINTIYFRTATEYYNTNRDLAKITFSLVSKFIILSIFPLTLIILFGPTLYVFFLGTNWLIAGQLSKYLIVLYVFSFTANITSYLRVAINKQSINFSVSLLKLLVVFFLILITSLINMNFNNFIPLYVVIFCIFYIVDMFINFVLLKSYFLKYLFISSLFLIYCLILWAI